jgi:hypothetical protein
MKLAIMQPYFLPYIGYFQLIHAADVFVVYDNIKYTKKGWINRNRFLRNGVTATFSLPLKKDSDALNVVGRKLACDFDRTKLLKQFSGAYRGAPCFAVTMQLLEQIVLHGETNLFRFVEHSIVSVCKYLGIETEIRVSSRIEADHDAKGQDKVLSICRTLGAATYINAIGGVELYSRTEFSMSGCELKFIRSLPLRYEQFGNEFVPWLSIIDVLMFNPIDVVKNWIERGYELI